MTEHNNFSIVPAEISTPKTKSEQLGIEILTLDNEDDYNEVRKEREFIRKHTFRIDGYPVNLLPGKVYGIVAGVNVGKTTILRSVVLDTCQKKKKILYISTEQDPKITRRYLYKQAELGLVSFEDLKYIHCAKITMLAREDLKLLFRQWSNEYDFILLDYAKTSTLDDTSSFWEKIAKVVEILVDEIARTKACAFVALQGGREGAKEDWGSIFKEVEKVIHGGDAIRSHLDGAIYVKMVSVKEREVGIIKYREEEDEIEGEFGKVFKLIYDRETKRVRLGARVMWDQQVSVPAKPKTTGERK